MTPYSPQRIMSKFTAGDGCWIWHASTNSLGYGIVSQRGITRPAHRALYEMLVGLVPEGLELDHLCRNTSCVRPDHLEPVTHAENMRRGQRAMATHCKRGHEYTEANTRWDERKQARICRACHLEDIHAYRARGGK